VVEAHPDRSHIQRNALGPFRGHMLEIIKTLGSFAGLATFAFTVWDRCVRGRPQVDVAAKKYGANSFKCIRLQNPGPADLFIVRVHTDPSIYVVAANDSFEAVEAALAGDDVNVLLRQGETCELPVVEPVDLPKDAPSQQVCFTIYWYKTNSSRLWQPALTVKTSTRDIRSIADAVAAGRSGVP
jgi:hypothetical protein